jgi:hypothetical protein
MAFFGLKTIQKRFAFTGNRTLDVRVKTKDFTIALSVDGAIQKSSGINYSENVSNSILQSLMNQIGRNDFLNR